MTPAPQQIIARENEHVRRRAARTHAKAARRVMHVASLDGPMTVDPRDFAGFSREQIEAGLTVPAVVDPGLLLPEGGR